MEQSGEYVIHILKPDWSIKKAEPKLRQGSLEINSKKLSGLLKRCHHLFLILKGR